MEGDNEHQLCGWHRDMKRYIKQLTRGGGSSVLEHEHRKCALHKKFNVAGLYLSHVVSAPQLSHDAHGKLAHGVRTRGADGRKWGRM
jgi:hypothetical protein